MVAFIWNFCIPFHLVFFISSELAWVSVCCYFESQKSFLIFACWNWTLSVVLFQHMASSWRTCYNRVLIGKIECTLHLTIIRFEPFFSNCQSETIIIFRWHSTYFFPDVIITDSPLHLLPDVLESLRHLGYVTVRKTKCIKYSEK